MSTEKILHRGSQFKIDCFQLSAAVVNEKSKWGKSSKRHKASERKFNENKANSRGREESIKYLQKIEILCCNQQLLSFPAWALTTRFDDDQ